MNAMTDLSRLMPDQAARGRHQSAAPGLDAASDYGVLLLGTMHMALSLDVLREVIPCPPEFSALPASAPGLLGAVSLRGRVLPVLDLRASLGWEAPRLASQVVVVLRHGGALLGLLADGVRGLARLPAGALDAMNSSSHPLLFIGSFERAEDGSVVSVLDAAALMSLPGVPLARDASAAEASVGACTQVPHCALMLVRCGPTRLAMDVADIHTTLPMVTLLPSAMDGRVCRGVIEHNGVRVPAIDTLALMALGSLPEGASCQALLLRLPSGLVALLVNQVIDITRVPETDLLALSPLAVKRPELFRAALCVPGQGDHLVVAGDALQRLPDLRALSGLNATPETAAGTAALNTASATETMVQTSSHTVITYNIGAEVATRLTQVLEVLPLPADHARLDSGHGAVIGMFTHRQHSITLVCLSTLLDGGVLPDPEQARVLVVENDGARFGFVVPRLCHIEGTVWESSPQHRSAAKPGVLGRHPLVEIGVGTKRRTLHLLDLQALAASLLRCTVPTQNEDADLEVLSAA